MALNRRGFTLIELVIYMGVFALASLLMAKIFQVSRSTQESTSAAYALTGQMDTCLQWLRRDLQETALESVRTYPGPMLTMISPRAPGTRADPGALEASQYGGPRWRKHVCYAVSAKPGAITGDLVRWEVELTAAEQGRHLPVVAPRPTAIPGAVRVLAHNVVASGQTVTGLGGQPAGWTGGDWGGFRVQFLRRAENATETESAETLSDLNPVENRTDVARNSRLIEVQLSVREGLVGGPSFYSTTFRVKPRY